MAKGSRPLRGVVSRVAWCRLMRFWRHESKVVERVGVAASLTATGATTEDAACGWVCAASRRDATSLALFTGSGPAANVVTSGAGAGRE